jgi:pSer/pThr/pTyr-binding forkhead associated (FHA) protein
VSAPGARLLCRTGDFAGATFELEGDTSIGRQRGNAVVLDSELLSRRHARIWEEDGTWWIEDLDSRNGTRVDGSAVGEPVRLARLNVITLADAVDLVFVHGAAAPAAEAAAEPPARPAEGLATRAERTAFGALPEGLEEGDRGPATVADRSGFAALPDDAAERESPATRVDRAGFGALPDDLGDGSETLVPPGARQQAAPSLSLAATLPGSGSTTFPLHPGENVLGRSASCDVHVPDEGHTISRNHAVVRVDGDRVVVEDLDSANGVWIGDERVERATLAPGDTFKLGPYLQFTLISS